MQSYSVLSKFYDSLMKDFPYDRYADFVDSNTQGQHGLDLFCGSGAMTVRLAKKGLKMQGLDASPDMLSRAAQFARQSGEDIVFCLGRAENFALSRKLDIITAVCDGINYISPKQAQRLFKRVKSALADTGVFIFDISSHYKLTKIIAGNMFFEDYDDITYYWRNKINKLRSVINMDIVFFLKENGVHIRRDEKHRQYIYKVSKLRSMLRTAGLCVSGLYDGDTFTAASPKSKRIIFLVRHAHNKQLSEG